MINIKVKEASTLTNEVLKEIKSIVEKLKQNIKDHRYKSDINITKLGVIHEFPFNENHTIELFGYITHKGSIKLNVIKRESKELLSLRMKIDNIKLRLDEINKEIKKYYDPNLIVTRKSPAYRKFEHEKIELINELATLKRCLRNKIITN